MKKILIGFIAFVSGCLVSAQTLSPVAVPTAGGYTSGGGVSLSYTVGETFNTTLAAGASLLSQGQQQPEIHLRTEQVIGALCPGGSLTVTFDASGYVAVNNMFTLELSDGSGSFDAPLVLATQTGTEGGSFALLIPNGSFPGAGYRVRVLSSQPSLAAPSLPIAACGCDLPEARCKTATALLNAAGQAAISFGDIDNSSSFGCGLQTVSLSPSNFNCANLGANTVTLTVTDVNNQSSSCLSVVTVSDPLLPGISCPAPTTVTCSGNIPAVNLSAVTVSDNCGTPAKSHVSDVTSNLICPSRKTVTRTYRATDASGNSTTCSQVIMVFDNVAPVFSTVPANVTVQCNSLPAVGSATATDGCGGSVTISYNGQSVTPGSCTDTYTLIRQWTATDACGNTKTATQQITVRDTQKPVFTASPANITVQCSTIPAPGNATATDNCDATVAITYNGETRTNGACTDSYTLTRRWTAADNCGNTQTITQKITVQDTQKPAFTSLPANLTLQCSDNLPNPGTATATDNCDPSVSITYLGENTTGGACAGSYQVQRIWVATDNCGNSTAATQTISVVDSQAPVFTSVPGNVTIQCSELTPAIGTATATDACGGYVQVLFQGQTMSPGNCPANRVLTRVWQAQDECGNIHTTSQTITIQDTQAPNFSNAPADVTLTCGASLPTVPGVLALDNCDTYVPVTYLGETSTGPNCPYTVTRRWTVADDCGNAVTHTQVITVSAQNIGAAAESRSAAPAEARRDLRLSPNPTRDELRIDLSDFAGQALRVSINGELGQLLWTKPVVGSAQPLSLRLRDLGATTGIYTVSVRTAEGVVSRRVVLVE